MKHLYVPSTSRTSLCTVNVWLTYVDEGHGDDTGLL